MPIRILDSAEPLSPAARASRSDSVVNTAQSDAQRVLRQEMTRYCLGEIHGRSFLIAGHRGAGKTTMVNDVLDKLLRRSYFGDTPMLRPLPVLLHGPNLFDSGPPTTKDEEAEKSGEPAKAQTADKAAADTRADQAQVALTYIILGLHRAVTREFAVAYRSRLTEGDLSQLSDNRRRERAELAAQFEIELAEDPAASRLKDFWVNAGLQSDGMLFERPPVPDQGARELVALNGMCSAHQRISGDLSGKETNTRSEGRSDETVWGLAPDTAALIKPVASVFTGAAVTAGVAVGSHSTAQGVLWGVLGALAASMSFKRTGTRTRKRQREVDMTFMPDLSLKTLDRVLPTLLLRLRNAGLAPVLVIDELDKVQRLPDRLIAMIRYLKQLFAENIFTCFLTDRSYLEYLRIQGDHAAYGITYSYFSYPLLIAYAPGDIDAYLQRLFSVDTPAPAAAPAPDAPLAPPAPGTLPGAAQAAPQTAPPPPPNDDALDLEVLKWVLRHRSQLHAMALTREIMAIRGEGDVVSIPPGFVRSDYAYRIDVTLQVAIELQLAAEHVKGWQRQRPLMLQVLIDALYFLSRGWLRGDSQVDLGHTGPGGLQAYLEGRMNLVELADPPVPAVAEVPAQGPAPTPTPATLTADDMILMADIVRGMAVFLSEANATRPADPAVRDQSVLDALLLGDRSLLVAERDAAGRPLPLRYHWRYWASGVGGRAGTLPGSATGPASATVQRAPDPAPAPDTREVVAAHAWIEAVERGLWSVLKDRHDPARPQGAAWTLLVQQTRVLPTSPAWSRVKAAHDNVVLLDRGQGNQAAFDDDCRAIFDFRALIQTHASTIGLALYAAALLGGMQIQGTPPGRLRAGLALLSAGLRFAEVDANGVETVLSDFQQSLVKEPGTGLDRTPWAIPAALPLDAAGWEVFIKELAAIRELGAQVASRAEWTVLQGRAWGSLYERLNGFADSETETDASVAEILCAARGTGPYPLLGLRLREVSIARWSACLFSAIERPSASGSGAGAATPAWLAVHAAGQLGAGQLESSLAERLLGLLLERARLDEAENKVLRELAFSRIWRSGGSSRRVALLVRAADRTLADGWIGKPKGGLMVVATAEQVEATVSFASTFLQVEPLVAIEETLLPKAVETLQESLSNFKYQPLWIYARPTRTMRTPSLVDPRSPDDVLAHA